jgi:hypothetical protein
LRPQRGRDRKQQKCHEIPVPARRRHGTTKLSRGSSFMFCSTFFPLITSL